jgi:hypothetical protein
MHDDFKPQFKAQRTGAVEDVIRHDISTNKVLLYMKVRPPASAPSSLERCAVPSLIQYPWNDVPRA